MAVLRLAALRLLLPLILLALLLALPGCGDDRASPPERVWAWIDVPGAVCGDGTPTGIGVNRGPGDRVVLFLDGGGACWDWLTCFVAETASDGPYGPPQLEADLRAAPGSILDPELPGNPYADATLVLVPYCTGDVHAGDAVQRYPGAPRDFHHRGRRNLAAAADWLQANLPPPAKVVVSGASAGGFGALLAFDAVRSRWPGARGYLVDDSGPPLVEEDFSPVLRAAWFLSWRLDRTVLPICGDCALDLSRLVPALAERYPQDRIGLLSSTQDQVIRTFVALSPASFEAAVLRLSRDVFGPLERAETFLVPGPGHTMLGAPAGFTVGGVGLLEWLRRQVEDDPAWASVGP